MFSDINEGDPLWEVLRIEEKGLDDRMGEWVRPHPLHIVPHPFPYRSSGADCEEDRTESYRSVYSESCDCHVTVN